jgi:hypothetical protein
VNAEEKLVAVARVLEEIILGHSPIANPADCLNRDYVRGREENKGWAMDQARKALAIIRGDR